MAVTPVILQILPALNQGGVERGTVDMARAIVEAGGTSLVMSSGGPLVSEIERAGATHITAPMHSKNPLRLWHNIGKVTRIIAKYGVHIVHVRSRAPAWSAYYATRNSNAKLLTTFHGTYSASSALKRRYNNIMLRGDHVIAVSDFIKQHILQHYDTDAAKITIVPRGADLEYFSPEAVDQTHLAELIAAWNLEDTHAPIIFCPGRITRWKGQHDVLQALAMLKDQKFICIFAGDDASSQYMKELYEQVNALGLTMHVRFVPSTRYMREAYYLSDMVLCPSIEPEAFGRIPIEAGAMQCVAISTNHGGARETVRHNDTGYLVKPGNIQQLRDHIDILLHMDETQRHAMGEKARQHVTEHFSLTSMQDATLDIYERMMRERKR